MDGKRTADALNDDALDRELEAALTVEPSPDFLARVRARVAVEPPPTIWGSRWMLPAAAGAIATVALVIAVSVPGNGTAEIAAPVRPASPPAARASTTQPDGMDDARPGAATVVPQGRMGQPTVPQGAGKRSVRAAVPASAAPAGERPFPEVVISAEERSAFELLLASIEQRQLPPVTEEVIAEGRALEAMPLEIRPLVIEPLAHADAVE